MATLSARGVAFSHREWLRLNAERHRMRRQWNAWFKDYDVLLCPPFSTAAIPHTTVPTAERTLMVNGSAQNFGNQLLWAGLAGALYLPATVAPLALTADGLPIGVQIIGRQYDDLTCLRFGRPARTRIPRVRSAARLRLNASHFGSRNSRPLIAPLIIPCCLSTSIQ